MKTRLDILTDIEDELCVRLPIDILPSDTNFDDKWYSEQEIRNKINNLNWDIGISKKLLIKILLKDEGVEYNQ